MDKSKIVGVIAVIAIVVSAAFIWKMSRGADNSAPAGPTGQAAAQKMTGGPGGPGGMPGGPGGPGGQGRGGGMRMTPQQRLEQMTKDLTLTDAQKKQVEPILMEMAPKMQALRSLPDDQRREQMQKLRGEQDKKVMAILTPKQQTLYKEMQARRRARMGGPGGPGGPGRPMMGGPGGSGRPMMGGMTPGSPRPAGGPPAGAPPGAP